MLNLRIVPGNQKGIGFKPNTIINSIRAACRSVIKLFRLNGSNFFSNEFIQCLDPKAFVDWNGHRLVFRTGHGRLKWRVDSFLDEEPMMIEWLASLDREDIFLDLGANVGMYSIPAAKMCKAVIAVELDAMNVGILAENLFLNHVTNNVVLVPIGVGDRNSVEQVFYRDFSKGDALQSVGRPSPFATRTTTFAHTRSQIIFRLDDFFAMFQLPQPNKIKIDVDGNERSVYEGGKKTILQATEIYYEDCPSEDSQYVLGQLIAHGFMVTKRELVANINFGGANNILLVRKPLEAV